MIRIEENKIITLAYTLRAGGPQGPILEQMDQNYPFKFYFGNKKLLPAFEENLAGLEEGAAFTFLLQPEMAYGPIREDLRMEVPKTIFDDDELLTVGQFVALTDDQGQSHNGKVLSWTKKAVKVDFNHEMAGKTLHFKGVVLNIRAATEQEKARRNYIEAGGVHRT
jgi:FKBP-type peptidyl-prolyl cis-trans isomerase SlyD